MVAVLRPQRDSVLVNFPSLRGADQMKSIVAVAVVTLGVLHEVEGLNVDLAYRLVAIDINQEVGERMLRGGVGFDDAFFQFDPLRAADLAGLLRARRKEQLD